MRSEADPQLRLLLDPVLKWLEEPGTEEVAINGPGEAFVRQAGVFTKHSLPLGYDDLEDIAILAERCASKMSDRKALSVRLSCRMESGYKSVCRPLFPQEQ